MDQTIQPCGRDRFSLGSTRFTDWVRVRRGNHVCACLLQGIHGAWFVFLDTDAGVFLRLVDYIKAVCTDVATSVDALLVRECVELCDIMYPALEYDILSLVDVVLLQCPKQDVRLAFREAIARSSMSHALPRAVFALLPRVECYLACSEFFSLACAVWEPNFISGPDILNLIQAHPVVERWDSFSVDHYLTGLCDLLRLVVDNTDWAEPEAVQLLFQQCLFDLPVGFTDTCLPKCKTAESRRAVFFVLDSLVKKDSRNKACLMDLVLQVTPATQTLDFDYTPSAAVRNVHVGLRNFGSTCYMNSILQLFYKNSSFVSTLLSETSSDALIEALQILFANLELSIRKSYAPAPLCAAFTTWDGSVVDVNVQMDVDEFFNILFDKIESGLKSSRIVWFSLNSG